MATAAQHHRRGPVRAKPLAADVDGKAFNPTDVRTGEGAEIVLTTGKHGRFSLTGFMRMVLDDEAAGTSAAVDIHLESKQDANGVPHTLLRAEPPRNDPENKASKAIADALNGHDANDDGSLFSTEQSTLALRLAYTCPMIPHENIDHYMGLWKNLGQVSRGIASRTRSHRPKRMPKNLQVTRTVVDAIHTTNDSEQLRSIGRNRVAATRELTNSFRTLLKEASAAADMYEKMCAEDQGYKTAMVSLMKEAIESRPDSRTKLDRKLASGGLGPRGMKIMVQRAAREWEKRSKTGLLFHARHNDDRLQPIMEAVYRHMDDFRRSTQTMSIGLDQSTERKREAGQETSLPQRATRHYRSAARGASGEIVQFPSSDGDGRR